jgi:hypothetical protein
MIRIVGILCGSALAISFLIVVLGMPEIFPNKEEAALLSAEEVVAPPPAVVEIAAVTEIEVAEVEPTAQAAEIEAEIVPEIEPAPEMPAETSPATEHWYAFWSPFGSELAANGFVSQLQRTTGLDYRVVRLKPGNYEVAFSYADDSDIATKLTAISTATGLEMPDG